MFNTCVVWETGGRVLAVPERVDVDLAVNTDLIVAFSSR